MMLRITIALLASMAPAVVTAAGSFRNGTDQSGPAWSSGQYVYDGAGNIAAIGTTANANGDGLYTNYTYDTLSRLVSVNTARVSSNAPGLPRTETYGYDPYGNMTRGTAKDGSPIDYGVDSGNHLAGASYDAAGNLTAYGGESYVYDATGMMVAKDHDTTWHDRFVYTAEDERIGARVGDTWTWTFRDSSGKALRQYESTSSSPAANWTWAEDYVYGPRGIVAAQRSTAAGGLRHFHVDHLGTPRLITNASGTAIAEHDYSPFGIELTSSRQEPGREEPKKFTGHERDLVPDGLLNPERYLDYMHSRYYGPGLGRFLTTDVHDGSPPNPQSWNQYSYAFNAPMDLVDANGRWPGKTHNQMLEKAFPGLPESMLGALKAASADVDLNQSPAKAYQHGMRAANQTVRQAEFLAAQFYTEQIDLATRIWRGEEKGTPEDAMMALGRALHLVMDLTSPAHRGFQVWDLWPNNIGKHRRRESKPPTAEEMNMAVTMMRVAFAQIFGDDMLEQAMDPLQSDRPLTQGRMDLPFEIPNDGGTVLECVDGVCR